MSAWTDHVARWKDCTKCPLAQQRDRICLGRGTVPCDVLFIGEAPGASEDALGKPFMGPAGHLLDQMIGQSLPPGVSHAMTNLVACFPRDAKLRGDNEPEHGEILDCRPRLVEFINLAQPRLIVCVGVLATAYIHGNTGPRVSIDHPAWILRMPLAQKNMAVQRNVVVLRCAVEDMLQSDYKFKRWANAEDTGTTKHIPF